MKTRISLIATAATLALFSTAKGQVVIDLTGSTAGRSAVTTQIQAILTGESAAWVGNASVTSAGKAIFYGGNFNGTPVTVRTFWSGSAAGVRDVADALRLNNSYIVSNYAGPVARNDAAALAPSSAATVSEIGFSDVFQSSTEFTANPLTQEDSVSVLPFVFVKNDGAPAALTNMTSEAFKALFSGLGTAPMSLFTGNAGDSSTTIFATGRNNESGTRITTLAVTGTGVFANLTQYQGSGDPATLTPFGSVPGFTAGQNGYPSGGNVAALLSATLTGPRALIGYVGISDGNTAVTGGAKFMTYEGIAYSANSVYNGQYPFWGYLHQSSQSISGVTASFYDSLRNALVANPGSGTLAPDLMNVERAADGAVITPK